MNRRLSAQLLYVSNARIPSEKANSYQVMQMCDALARRGIKVRLLAPRRGGCSRGQDVWEYYGMTPRFELRQLYCVDLLNQIRPTWTRLLKLVFYIQVVSYWLTCTLYGLVDRSPVLYTREPLMLLGSLLFPRQRRVLEVHAIPVNWISRWIQIRACRKANLVVVISRQLETDLRNLGVKDDKFLYGPDGVDLRLYAGMAQPDFERSEVVVGYTGQLFSWKGTATLVEAFCHLPANYRLLVCGGMPEDIDRLERKARELRLANVSFMGHLPPREVLPIINQCHILVLPNSGKSRMSRLHTSPLKMFEYMAAGRPIVASDLPSLREVLVHQQNAFLVAPDDPVALAAGIRKVAEDHELARKLAQHAREEVPRYDWLHRAAIIAQACGLE